MAGTSLIDKSIAFSTRIVKLYRSLTEEKSEYHISKHILRSATSIGVNINEANYAQNDEDTEIKFRIALKETAETEYWLKLLIALEYTSKTQNDSLLDECLDLKRALVSTIGKLKK